MTKNHKRDTSRTRILDESARLFRQKGYAAVSLRAIADAANMKAGSVYYHFSSKEEIVIAVLNKGVKVVHDEVAAGIERLPDDASADDLIRSGIVNHLKALLEFSNYTSANVRIYGQVPESVRDANRIVRLEYEACWNQILKTAVKKGGVRQGVDLKVFRMLLIGSLNATLEWFDPFKGEVKNLADRYADLLLCGFLVNQKVGA